MTIQAAALILAAGQGTRMKSKTAKVLHPIAGIPMVEQVYRSLKGAGLEQIYLVVGHQKEQVQTALPQLETVVQSKQLGTGHAVSICRQVLAGFDGPVLVTYGDTPLFRSETFAALIEQHQATNAAATVITSIVDDPSGYGRILRDQDDYVIGIVEDKDASDKQREITEINTGTYCFDGQLLFDYLARIKPQNAQGEYYLPDIIPLLVADGKPIGGYLLADSQESLGVNTRVQLAAAQQIMEDRLRKQWMLAGVTMIDPARVHLEMDVQIGEDTQLNPGVYLQKGTVIGEDCLVGPNVRIANSRLANGVSIENTVVVDSEIGENCQVGPFAYLRPNSKVGANCKIGDFVELKNTTVDHNTKIPHLSYVGDSQVGTGVNIGCGTITCNYDGKNKNRTIIKDHVFIGSNSNLVAPVEIGEGAYVAAGSTINEDVPKDSLAIARARQVTKEGWTKRRGKSDSKST